MVALLRFRRLNLSGGAVWCLLALSARLEAGEQPSVADLANDLQVSDHAIVRRWLRELEKAGAVTRRMVAGRTAEIGIADPPSGPPQSASGPPLPGQPLSASGPPQSGHTRSARGQTQSGPPRSSGGHTLSGLARASDQRSSLSQGVFPLVGGKNPSHARGDGPGKGGPDRLSPDIRGPAHARHRAGSDGREHAWPFGDVEWPSLEAPITDWDWYVGVNHYPRRYVLNDDGFPTGRRESAEGAA